VASYHAPVSSPPDSVLFATPLWGRDGGIAAHVQASAQLLAARGVRVTVLAARVDPNLAVAGVGVIHSPQLCRAHAPIDARLGAAGALRPDVAHLHQLDDPDVIAALRRRAPVVLSAHGYPACTAGVHYFRPGHECTRAHGPGCAVNLALRGCAHVRNPRPLPDSYRRATRALQALRLADVAVAYASVVDRHLAANGVARRAVIPLFATTPPRPGTDVPGRRRVLFAGRVVRPKGLGVLIRAIRAVDAELVVCGEGLQLAAMRHLAQRLGVGERVRFRGWLDAERLAQEVAEATVVAIPSLWPEPFGLVGIEALATGRAVVASLTGGVGDWLEDGVTGVAVRPGDVGGLARALDGLLADPARRCALGEAGRELVAARFSPERHVTALLETYGTAHAYWEAAV
jgi:glycosyltransferase involved in cell wall biosynthesis